MWCLVFDLWSGFFDLPVGGYLFAGRVCVLVVIVIASLLFVVGWFAVWLDLSVGCGMCFWWVWFLAWVCCLIFLVFGWVGFILRVGCGGFGGPGCCVWMFGLCSVARFGWLFVWFVVGVWASCFGVWEFLVLGF